jgi:hypothetical protein
MIVFAASPWGRREVAASALKESEILAVPCYERWRSGSIEICFSKLWQLPNEWFETLTG